MSGKCFLFGIFFIVGCFSSLSCSKDSDTVGRHVAVWKQEGRYGGWPANYGIWSWGNEIVVGFEVGYFKVVPDRHYIDPEKPSVPMQARSKDGGETWIIEEFSPQQDSLFFNTGGGIDFTHPNFTMTLRMNNYKKGYSQFYLSYDRAKLWKGPFPLPTFDQQWIAARTDYIINDMHDCFAFLTASKSNGDEGRAFVSHSSDGGKSWQFMSWITPEPEGFTIMPSSVRLSATEIITAIRIKENDKGWIQIYKSTDNGTTWSFVSDASRKMGKSGNPPSMLKLKDGRLCLTYGFRDAPYSILARLSKDNGQTWSDDIVIRNDGGRWDLGYTRSVQREDGKIVTVYYFNDDKNETCYIAASLWNPDSK